MIRAVDAPLPPYAQQDGRYPHRADVAVGAHATAAYPPSRPLRATSRHRAAPTAPRRRACRRDGRDLDAAAGRRVEPARRLRCSPTPAPAATQVGARRRARPRRPVDIASQPASTVAAAMPPALAETVTCPECGTIAQVTLNRRESMDFCRTCDYPLFWTPTKVVRDASGIERRVAAPAAGPGRPGDDRLAAVPVLLRAERAVGADLHPLPPADAPGRGAAAARRRSTSRRPSRSSSRQPKQGRLVGVGVARPRRRRADRARRADRHRHHRLTSQRALPARGGAGAADRPTEG